MTAYIQTVRSRETFSASWYLTPILAAALVTSIFFVDGRSEAGPADDIAAIDAAVDAGVEIAPHHALLLTPSPQPGEGEPALVPSELPASY